MTLFSTHRKAIQWMLVFSGILFLLKAAFIVATPVRALVLSPWLIDDSFIVMRIARNLALGHGFSFDGIHPTTGVSMLWAHLTSLTHLFLSKEGAVKATLLTSTLLGTISTILLFLLALATSGKKEVAWIAFLGASLLPVPFFNAMNGMETSLFTVLILLALGLAGTIGENRTPALSRGIIIGFSLGLALLTRADALFAIAAIGLLYAFHFWRQPRERRMLARESFAILGALGLCILLLALWQLSQTGSLFPDNQIGRRAIALSKHQFDFAAFSLKRYLTISGWNVFQLESLWSLGVGSSLLGLLALGTALQEKSLRSLAALTALYLLLFSLALVCYQWYFPDFHGLRYLNPGIHLILLCIALLLSLLAARGFPRAFLVFFPLCLLAVSMYRYNDMARRPDWAADMGLFGNRSEEATERFWATADYITREIEPGAVIAARDHGRLAFFTDRPIQDLAGILDPGILIAQKEDRLADYLHERNVEYIYLPDAIEGDASIYAALWRSLSLEHLPGAPRDNQRGFTLYRILWPKM